MLDLSRLRMRLYEPRMLAGAVSGLRNIQPAAGETGHPSGRRTSGDVRRLVAMTFGTRIRAGFVWIHPFDWSIAIPCGRLVFGVGAGRRYRVVAGTWKRGMRTILARAGCVRLFEAGVDDGSDLYDRGGLVD